MAKKKQVYSARVEPSDLDQARAFPYEEMLHKEEVERLQRVADEEKCRVVVQIPREKSDKEFLDSLRPAADDPWKHRSKGMRCATCMWYVEKQGKIVLGRCRRHAPSMNGYPAVFPVDWCGDHKLDENKS